MNLSKYNATDELGAADLKRKYEHLRAELERLGAAPVKDMSAIDAVIVERDEVHAALKRWHLSGGDSQRF